MKFTPEQKRKLLSPADEALFEEALKPRVAKISLQEFQKYRGIFLAPMGAAVEYLDWCAVSGDVYTAVNVMQGDKVAFTVPPIHQPLTAHDNASRSNVSRDIVNARRESQGNPNMRIRLEERAMQDRVQPMKLSAHACKQWYDFYMAIGADEKAKVIKAKMEGFADDNTPSTNTLVLADEDTCGDF